MPDGFHGARRPRPVADVPPDALADGVAVAKAWLLALLAEAPLTDAARVPVAELAAEGPVLCAALLRAVGSDAALVRLAAGGDLEATAAGAAALAGAGSAAAAAAAVARLREALWAALVADDAPRGDAAAAAALAERVAHVADVVTAAVLARPVGDALRGAEEPWLVAVERLLAAHRRDGAAFAVLVVEAADGERLRAAGGGAAALEPVEAAVRAAVRPGDPVVRERAGRLWIVAPGLDAGAARELAERLAAAVAAAAAPHGAPLAAAAGTATCPADGEDARALVDRADERLFAALAAGVPVV
jgi:GGDEF domain-containing protein